MIAKMKKIFATKCPKEYIFLGRPFSNPLSQPHRAASTRSTSDHNDDSGSIIGQFQRDDNNDIFRRRTTRHDDNARAVGWIAEEEEKHWIRCGFVQQPDSWACQCHFL